MSLKIFEGSAIQNYEYIASAVETVANHQRTSTL